MSRWIGSLVELHFKLWGHMRSSALKQGCQARPGTWRLKVSSPSGGLGFERDAWYMTKAPLKGLVEVQICRNKEQSHHPCIGLLLYYEDQSGRSSRTVPFGSRNFRQNPCANTNPKGRIAGKDYIKNIQGSMPSDSDMGKGWQEIPASGTVFWWFGEVGDRIVVHSE